MIQSVKRSTLRGWGIFLAGLFSLACVLVLGLWGYDRWANNVPPFRPPAVAMPSPNGYEIAAALARRLPADPAYQGKLPRWPDGPPEEIRKILRPARPTLDAIRATYRLEWRSPQRLGMLDWRRPARSGERPHHPLYIRGRSCARFFTAEGLLAEHEGDVATALECRFDAMELAARSSRGAPILSGLEASAQHQLGFAGISRLLPRLPETALRSALQRVRRIQKSWPSYAEVLEAERVYTLADTSASLDVYDHRTPLQTLKCAWELLQVIGSDDRSRIGEYTLLWLTPKRSALDDMDRWFRRWIQESRKPVERWQPVPLPNDPLSRITLWPELMLGWLGRKQSDLEMLEVALAVEIHRREHGRYPMRLSEVSQRWLPTAPVSGSGRPVMYELRHARPVIYCPGRGGGRYPFDAQRPVRPAGVNKAAAR